MKWNNIKNSTLGLKSFNSYIPLPFFFHLLGVLPASLATTRGNQATPQQHERRTRYSVSRAVNSRYLVGTGRTMALRHLVGQFPGTQRARFPNHLKAHVHFLRLNHSSVSSQGCRPGSNTPQRAQDTDPKGADVKPASLLRNLVLTLQLRVDSSTFKVFLSGVPS